MRFPKSALLALIVYMIIRSSQKFGFVIPFILFVLIIIVFVYFSNPKNSDNLDLIHLIDDISSSPNTINSNFPKWLTYKGHEKTHFLNYSFRVMWNPKLKNCFEKSVFPFIERKLEQKKISVVRLDLGTTSPIVKYINIGNTNCAQCGKHKCTRKKCEDLSCSIVVEIYFESDDAEIDVSTEYKTAKTNLCLTNLKFSATLVIKFFDLVNVVPGFSKYSISILDFPEFDFNTQYVGRKFTYSNIPLISGKLNRFFKREMFANVVYPKSKVTKMNKDAVQQKRRDNNLVLNGENFDRSEGCVTVLKLEVQLNSFIKWLPNSRSMHVAVENRNGKLPDGDFLDWYCVLGLKSRHKKYMTKDKVVLYGYSTILWDEQFAFYEFSADSSDLKEKLLCVDLFLRGAEMSFLMGQCVVDLEKVLDEGNSEKKNCVLDVQEDVIDISNYPDGCFILGKLNIKLKYNAPEKRIMKRKKLIKFFSSKDKSTFLNNDKKEKTKKKTRKSF